MASISFIIDQIKQDPSRLLSHLPIREVCVLHAGRWRERILDPATTVALFIQQIINGNSSCAEVRHRGGNRRFSAQAYCKARRRLSLAVLQALCRRVSDEAGALHASEKDYLFLTHRVFVVDGSTFSMPDTPELQKEFGQPAGQKKGCGFPVAHLLAMFDVNTGMLLEAIASPLRTTDLANMGRMHPLLREGDLVMGDSAFGSYTHFSLLLQAKLHGLMPNPTIRTVDFRPHRAHALPQQAEETWAAGLPRSRWIRSLGEDDQVVEWFKPKSGNRPNYMSKEQYKALPASILVRELRRRVYRPELDSWVELIIITTLLDEKTYPAEKLVELRLRRWQIEVNFRHLKTTMGLDVLKCKTVQGVRKELAVFALVYNVIRLIMLEAATRQKTQPDRISFADVLGWVRVASEGTEMPRFIINPRRPGRIEPRVRKRRPKQYPLLNRPRQIMRNALKKQAPTATKPLS